MAQPVTLGRRAWLAAMLAAGSAAALGRIPYAGTLALRVPWPLHAVDPHAPGNAAGALFGAAFADTLFAEERPGAPYPTLARALPEPSPGGARVTLRPGLVTALGRPLTARDAVWSIERARRGVAAALLAPLAQPQLVPGDPLSFVVPGADPAFVASVLASRWLALLPRGFSPTRPDGTGPFRAEPQAGRLLLTRNGRAARGPAFLERLTVQVGRDLADCLRAFEAGDVDVGWLGAGLYRPRPQSVAYDAGRLGWVVLLTGRTLGAWGAPGVLQPVLDGIPAERWLHLGVMPGRRGPTLPWNGPRTELWVADDSPHLIQIADALAALLSHPDHELTVRRERASELAQRKASQQFGMLLDFVQAPEGSGPNAALALLSALPAAERRKPPRWADPDPRELARTLPLGVVGELRIAGAHAADVRGGLERWDLGNVYRAVS